jgi:hypothetical protein
MLFLSFLLIWWATSRGYGESRRARADRCTFREFCHALQPFNQLLHLRQRLAGIACALRRVRRGSMPSANEANPKWTLWLALQILPALRWSFSSRPVWLLAALFAAPLPVLRPRNLARYPCRFSGSAASRFSNRSAREERVIARRGGRNSRHHRLRCLLAVAAASSSPQSVLLDFLVHCASIDPQDSRGPRDVLSGMLQGRVDYQPLHFIELQSDLDRESRATLLHTGSLYAP